MWKRATVASRLAAGAAAAGALVFGTPVESTLAGGPGSPHPRDEIFAGTATRRLVDEFSRTARLTILFHPDMGKCEPQHIAIVLALRRLLEEHSDIEVLTVLPAASAEVKTLLGETLPGRVVVLDNPTYVSEGRISPRPRLEVWSHDRRLLLLRSIPLAASEDSIYQEVLWSLAFTGPVDSEAVPLPAGDGGGRPPSPD